jgi:hypothetical protein
VVALPGGLPLGGLVVLLLTLLGVGHPTKL